MGITLLPGCGGGGGGGGSTTPVQTTVATPAISPAGGTFTTARSVTITGSTAGATIYYTTDGSTPTTSSNTYTAPFTISTNQTVSAIAVASGDANSGQATASYTFSTDFGNMVNVQYPVSTSLDSSQFQIKNAANGMVVGINNQSHAAGASVVQEANTGSTDSMWHFMQQVDNTGDYRANVENMLTHQVVGLSAVAPTLVYHYYDGNNNGWPLLGINRIGFTDDGWPVE